MLKYNPNGLDQANHTLNLAKVLHNQQERSYDDAWINPVRREHIFYVDGTVNTAGPDSNDLVRELCKGSLRSGARRGTQPLS